jgi:hypothetical protein
MVEPTLADNEVGAYINARERLRHPLLDGEPSPDHLWPVERRRAAQEVIEAADVMYARIEKLLPFVQAVAELQDKDLPLVYPESIRDQAREALK